MTPRTFCPGFVLPSLLLFALPAMAGGALEDYQRAERLLDSDDGSLRTGFFWVS